MTPARQSTVRLTGVSRELGPGKLGRDRVPVPRRPTSSGRMPRRGTPASTASTGSATGSRAPGSPRPSPGRGTRCGDSPSGTATVPRRTAPSDSTSGADASPWAGPGSGREPSRSRRSPTWGSAAPSQPDTAIARGHDAWATQGRRW